jgi:hypothetical protein
LVGLRQDVSLSLIKCDTSKGVPNPYENWTDEQLGEYQAKNEPTGRPIFEMMRRLKDSLLEQQKTTNELTKRLYWYTVAIFFVAAVQVVLFIYQIFFLTV